MMIGRVTVRATEVYAHVSVLVREVIELLAAGASKRYLDGTLGGGGHAEKVRILSPVITSAPVLGTLAQRIADGRGDIAGCVDATQVTEVMRQWQADGNVSWKLPLLKQVLAGEFTGKPSVPWQPTGTLHNFMHAKVVIADDTVFVGSFNLSHSGEKNAENVLELEDPGLARQLSSYVDEVRALYPPVASDAGPAA